MQPGEEIGLKEYESLREESAHARKDWQTILQWSLGAFAVVFAGAFAVARLATPGIERLRMAVFGLAMPGLVIGSCLAWVGELLRMQRVGSYLRGRERAFWPNGEKKVERSSVRDLGSYPLLWENYIASQGVEPGQRKLREEYVGAGLIYGGAYVVSMVVFLITVWAHHFGAQRTAWRVGATAYAIALTLGCGWLFGRMAGRVGHMRTHIAGYLCRSCPLPEMIGEARKRHHLTRGELASALGVPEGTIDGWERGKHAPNDDELRLLCDTFDWPSPSP